MQLDTDLQEQRNGVGAASSQSPHHRVAIISGIKLQVDLTFLGWPST
jgi:hypothetical protein